MPVPTFIDRCESGPFIDYDGYARGLVLNGFLVNNEVITPTDALLFKKKLLQRAETHEGLKIAWYNR